MKLLSIVLQLLIILTVSSQNLEDNLLLYYPFDNNVNDESGNSNDAINFGATFGEDRFGNSNSAFYFDGIDDYINLPNTSELKPNLPVSFSFWIKYETNGYRPVFNTSFEEDKSSGVYFNSNSGGNYSISFGDGSDFYSSNTRSTFISEANATINEWNFVVVIVESSGQMKIFEGCKEYEGTYSGTGGDLDYSLTPGSIGRHDRNTNLPADFFKGAIDDFRYWNRALSNEDIIELNNTDKFSLGSDVISCEGDTIIKLSAPVSEDLTYEWNTGETNAEIYVTESGEYILNLTQGLCKSSDTVEIVIQEKPTVYLGDDLVFCADTSFVLKVNAGENLIYEWNTGEGNSQITVDKSGEYIIKIRDGSCENSDTINIIIDNSLTLNLGEDLSFCGDTIISLSGYLGNNYTYLWNTGDTISDITVNDSGIYVLSVSNENCNLSDSIFINIYSIAPLDLGEDFTYCFTNNIPIELSVNNYFTEYLWNNGSTESFISVSENGTYSIFATDINDCTNSDSIEIKEGCSADFFVPNAFSPNSDRINDTFRPIGNITDENYSLVIYNRYAEKVFETNNFEEGWDGTYKNLKQPIGVFVWIIQLSNTNRQTKIMKGNLTIVR